MSSSQPKPPPWMDILLLAAVLAAFLQTLADFLAAVYAFGLLGVAIPPEIAVLVVLFSAWLLLFVPRPPRGRTLAVVLLAALACSAVAPWLGTRERMLACGLGVSLNLVGLPLLLRQAGGDRAGGRRLGTALALGTAFLVGLRAAGSGVIWFGVGEAALLVALAVTLARRGGTEARVADVERGQEPGWGKVIGLSLGICATLAMLYLGFMAPNVVARWLGANTLGVLALSGLALAAGAALMALGGPFARARRALLSPAGLLAWNGLFLLALAAGLRLGTLRFPLDPAAYPLAEPGMPVISKLLIGLALLLFPVIFVDFGLYCRELGRLQPSPRKLGAGFGLGGLFLLALILMHVATTVYDYLPVIGPLMRDRFWVVYLAAGLAMVAPLALVKRVEWGEEPQGQNEKLAVGLAALLLILGLGLAGMRATRPLAPAGAGGGLRVLTYNIQQGYGKDGQKNYAGQMRLMRQMAPDVIGLQECDTNRIANANDDLVGYLASELGLHSSYGPSPVRGTFGLALLSRYPIESPRVVYFYSKGEQTAAIQATIHKDGKAYTVFVTHLGNGGPLIQQQNLLQTAQGLPNVLMMGDFNFRPGGEQYALTTQSYADAWLLRWPSGTDDNGYHPDRRIDHVFVSPGLQVEEAQYLTGPESDHPGLFVIVR